MLSSYQFGVDVVKCFYDFLKTRFSGRFESYFIKSIYEVTFKLHRQLGFQKIAKVFNCINSELIRQQHQEDGRFKDFPKIFDPHYCARVVLIFISSISFQIQAHCIKPMSIYFNLKSLIESNDYFRTLRYIFSPNTN